MTVLEQEGGGGMALLRAGMRVCRCRGAAAVLQVSARDSL